jgi:hypothetical protein
VNSAISLNESAGYTLRRSVIISSGRNEGQAEKSQAELQSLEAPADETVVARRTQWEITAGCPSESKLAETILMMSRR